MGDARKVGAAALAAGGLAAIVIASAPLEVAGVQRGAKTHEVVIQGLLYVPETLTVRAGDAVVFINRDPFPHTATAAGVFDSGPIAPDKSWRYTARKAGSHPYLCTLHTTMKGTLNVE